jgi:hypothetical protein
MPNRSIILLLLIVLAAVPGAWAAVNVKTIPPSPPTAKLRVFVYSFTQVDSALRRGARWETTDDDFTAIQAHHLEKSGIYEIVSRSDVKAAIGDQFFVYEQVERNDWSLAREMGKALHADYVMVVSRQKQKGRQGVDYLFQGVLINTETGKNFRSGFKFEHLTPADFNEVVERNKQVYHAIFNLAKEDLLAVAVRKAKAFTSTPTVRPEVKPEQAPAPAEEERHAAADTGRSEGAKKVLVYDLDSNEQNRIVAMILAESLREEVPALKGFALVDREDLQKVRKSMTPQGMELADEKQALSMGKGVGADQIVTGHLGIEGGAFVVQAKRMDVMTAATLSRASLQFRAGQEGEAIRRLPEFARELMGIQQ